MMSRRAVIFAVIWCIAMLVALPLDAPIAARVRDSGLARHVQGTRWAEVVKTPGEFWFNPASCVLLLVLAQIRFKQAMFVILCGIASGANAVVKWIVGRFRPYKVPGTYGLHPFALHPFWHGIQGLFNQHDLCFPSGHACTAFALATAMMIVWRRGAWIFIALACAVGVERISENAHYFSDVVGGVGFAMLGTQLLYRLLDSWTNPRPISA